MTHEQAVNVVKRVRDEVSRVFVGKAEQVDIVLVAFLTGGHVLIEDVPGVGKTFLARTIAQCLGLEFNRIQFTPDLLPSDVTGSSIFNQKTMEFEFRGGPVFADIVLVDEINRATPRTQSSLLECMEERQVTADGRTHPMSPHFFVLATENPIELYGTFPLPEAQLDRFLVKVSLGYPTEQEERTIVDRFAVGAAGSDGAKSVTSAEEMAQVKEVARGTFLSAELTAYIAGICRTTRGFAGVELGASPRATLSLSRAAKSYAFMQGRSYVIPDDVKKLAVPVLSHRLILKETSALRGDSPADVIRDILEQVEVPVGASADHR